MDTIADFTELQQGTFHLTIEGNMFKVEVRFPLKAVKNVDNSPEFARYNLYEKDAERRKCEMAGNWQRDCHRL